MRDRDETRRDRLGLVERVNNRRWSEDTKSDTFPSNFGQAVARRREMAVVAIAQRNYRRKTW